MPNYWIKQPCAESHQYPRSFSSAESPIGVSRNGIRHHHVDLISAMTISSAECPAGVRHRSDAVARAFQRLSQKSDRVDGRATDRA